MFYQNLSVIWSKVFHSNTRYQFYMNSVLPNSGSISTSLSEVIWETFVGSFISKLDLISLLIIAIWFVRLGNFFCLGDIFLKILSWSSCRSLKLWQILDHVSSVGINGGRSAFILLFSSSWSKSPPWSSFSLPDKLEHHGN